MSTGYGWEGIRQVCAMLLQLLGSRHVPERLWGGSVYTWGAIQVFDLYLFTFIHINETAGREEKNYKRTDGPLRGCRSSFLVSYRRLPRLYWWIRGRECHSCLQCTPDNSHRCDPTSPRDTDLRAYTDHSYSTASLYTHTQHSHDTPPCRHGPLLQYSITVHIRTA